MLNLFNWNRLKSGKTRILNYLIQGCHNTRLRLNSHVKLVSYHRQNPNEKTTLVFVKNSKEFMKTYDYVIIAFPLTKDIKNQNFSLDILYRDFLDCEMNRLDSYIINGKFTMLSPIEPNREFSIHTLDSSLKFQSIQTLTCSTTETVKRSAKQEAQILYNIISPKSLDNLVFDALFEKDYVILRKMQHSCVPFYKKVKYSHTPFPQIIIDGNSRSRVFYLNGLEWLESSKETNCIAARNISILIAKKEISLKRLRDKSFLLKKFSHSNNLSNQLKNLTIFGFFISVFTFLYFNEIN